MDGPCQKCIPLTLLRNNKMVYDFYGHDCIDFGLFSSKHFTAIETKAHPYSLLNAIVYYSQMRFFFSTI